MTHKIIAQIFSKNLIIRKNITAILLVFFLLSCQSSKTDLREPKWYLSPTQNNSELIYGTAQGYTLSQATRLALADAASKLMTTISSNTSSLMKENNYDSFEEIKQKVSENIEKISFSNYQVSQSKKIDQTYYIEVSIPREQFLKEQEQKAYILNKKIAQLDKSSKNSNHINRRNNLLRINDLAKDLTLHLRILSGANQINNLNAELDNLLKYQNEFEQFNDKIEFFIPRNTHPLVKNTVTKYLNKQNIKVSNNRNRNNSNQILLNISLEKNTHELFNSYITKTNITFKNILNNQVIASNKISLSGSSTINEEMSFSSSIKELDEKLQSDDILKIIGIIASSP